MIYNQRLLLAGERAQRAAARDMAERFHAKPAVKRQRLRASCRLNLEKFLLTYMRASFPLRFSADHSAVVAGIQRAVIGGGLELLAV